MKEIDNSPTIGVKIVTPEGTVAEIRTSKGEQLPRIVAMAKTYPGGRIEYSVRRTVGGVRVSQKLGKGPEGFDRALEVLGG